MDTLTVETFIEIYFDIMKRIIEEFEPIRNKILEDYKDNFFERSNRIREEFSNLQRKYQTELYEKYGISFVTFNQFGAVYRSEIENYLSDKPELRKQYEELRNKIKIT